MWRRSIVSLGAPRLAVVAAAALGVAACGARRASTSGAATEPAVVVFANESLYEAAVYIVPRGGSQQRIGTVQPGRTDTLRIRASMLAGSGTVAVVARVSGVGRTPSTGGITLLPGDRVSVRLPPDAFTLSVLPAP